jgi:Helix-turn-helix domain
VRDNFLSLGVFIMSKLSAKQRILNALKQPEGQNSFTVKKARQRFGVTNVAARIAELRQEGYCIYTNKKTLEDGRKISYYRLGKPNRDIVKFAVSAGYSFSA